MAKKSIQDIFTGEDSVHCLLPPTGTEKEFQKAGMIIRGKSEIKPNPICIQCNAPPSCRGVAVGQNCPYDPTK